MLNFTPLIHFIDKTKIILSYNTGIHTFNMYVMDNWSDLLNHSSSVKDKYANASWTFAQ